MGNRMKHPHMLTRLLPILLCAVAAGGLLLAAQPVSAVDSGPTISPAYCMQSVFSGQTAEPIPNSVKLNCTANDIRISRAIDVSQTSCIEGSTFNLTGTFEVIVTANARYDAGFFFNIKGGPNARLGDQDCSLCVLTPNIAPSQNLDGDTCGDLNAGTYNVTFTIPGVLCNDSDGDGFLNLPNCTSWHSNASTVCGQLTADDLYGTLADNADPDTKSKCVCDDTFQVPVVVEHPNIGVQKEANPTQLNEPGGAVSYTVTVTNPAQVASVTITQITEDDTNNGTVDFTFNSTSTPTLASICDRLVLAPCGSDPNNCAAASTATCTFTRTVSGNAGQDIVDKACVSGTDSNGGAVGPTCATATVSIAGVAPTANVTKTFNSLQCAVVRFHVKVENTDLVEPLALTALSDTPFGSITTVHDDVLGTTCGVPAGLGTLAGALGAGVLPASIAVSGNYQCDFDAYFCSSSNTNTVTAKLTDNDYSCSASGDACLTNADCAAQTCKDAKCSDTGSDCTADGDCAANTCVLNEITKTSSVTVGVAVIGHCSETTTQVCLVNANCPNGQTCMIP